MASIELSAYRTVGIGFFRDVIKIMFHPADFYREMPTTKHPLTALVFLCSCAIFYSITATFFAHEHHVTYFFLLLANGMLYPVVTALGLHLVLRATGATKAGFPATFRIVAYANAVLLLAWIPGIAPFTEIFKYYLIGTGLVNTRTTTWIKAIAAIFATLGLLLLALYLTNTFIASGSM